MIKTVIGHIVAILTINICAKTSTVTPFFMHFCDVHIIITKWTKFQKILNTPSFLVESP